MNSKSLSSEEANLDFKNSPAGGKSPEPRSGAVSENTRRIALLFLVVIWVGFDFPVFSGKVLFPVQGAQSAYPYVLYRKAPLPADIEHDAYFQYMPMRVYLGNRLRQGDVPLWDPHRMAGVPFAANPQAGVWYPPNWLFAVGNPLHVYSLLAVFSRLVALLIGYWFFRVLKLHPFAAVAGATLLTFNLFMITWSLNPTFVGSAMWLPLSLGGTYLIIRQGELRGIALTALGLALSVLGGHPQILTFTWLIVIVWMAVLLVTETRKPVDRSPRESGSVNKTVRLTLLLGSGIALGIGLSSLQILSSAELAPRIARQTEEFENVQQFRLPPAHAMTFLVPDRLGNPRDGNYVGLLNYTETAGYVGVFTLVLAGVSLWHRRNRITTSFLLFSLIGGLAAFGTPILRFLFEIVPLLDQTRIPTRFLFLVQVGLAGLAAIGLDAVLAERGRAIPVLLVGAFLVIGASVASGIFERADPRITSAYLRPRIILSITIVSLGVILTIVLTRWQRVRQASAISLVALMSIDMWLAGFSYHRFQDAAPVHPHVPESRFLATRPGDRPRYALLEEFWLPPNFALQHGLYSIDAYDNLILRDMVELLSVAQAGFAEFARHYNTVGALSADALSSPVPRLLGVSHIVGPRSTVLPGSQVFSGELAIYEIENSLPTAFVVNCWELVDKTKAIARLRKAANTIQSSAFIEDRPDARRSLRGLQPSASCSRPRAADVTSYAPESVSIKLPMLDRAGILILSDSAYPGWKARIDGEITPMLIVDHALRGVVVRPGSREVEMKFEPRWFQPAFVGTLVSLFITVTLLVGPGLFFAAVRRKPRKTEPARQVSP